MKRTISLILCLLIIVALLPTAAVSAADWLTLPDSFDAPQCAYVEEEDDTLWLHFAQPRNFLEFKMAFDSGRWADENGGDTNQDYWWTPYGIDYSLDALTTQVDWTVDNGSWQYDSSWDDSVIPENCCWEDGLYLTGAGQSNYARVFTKDESEITDSSSIVYPIAGCFKQVTDGWGDTYYHFDSQNHTIKLRCRYAAEVVLPSGDTKRIFSDWSQTATYGKQRNTVDFPTNITAVPDISNYSVDETAAVDSTPRIFITSFAPSDLVILDDIRESLNESNYRNEGCDLKIEYSLNGTDWEEEAYTSYDVSREPDDFYVDLFSVWWELVAQPGEEFSWDGSSVYLRAKYVLKASVADYGSGDVQYYDVELESPYSSTVRVRFSEVDSYLITVSHTGTGYGGNGTKSHNLIRGNAIGWVYPDAVEGCYVDSVTVNGEVKYNKSDISTHSLLQWDDDGTFKLLGDADIPTDDVSIVIDYAGTPTGVHRLLVNGDLSDGSVYLDNYVSSVSDGFTVYDGAPTIVTVSSDTGARIKSLKIDGVSLTGAAGQTSYTYDFVSFNKDYTLDVEFERTAYLISYTVGGRGTATVATPTGFDETMDYVDKDGTFTINFKADDGYAIESVMVNGTLDALAASKGTLTISKVNADTSIVINFTNAPAEYVTLTVICNSGGTCNPIGPVQVVKGGSEYIEFVPESGYKVGKLMIGDKEISNLKDNFYIISDITADTEMNVEFVPDEYVYRYGDANMDKGVNVKDATLVQKAAALMVTLTEQQITLADVNADTNVNVKDATLIQKYAASMISEFPVETAG